MRPTSCKKLFLPMSEDEYPLGVFFFRRARLSQASTTRYNLYFYTPGCDGFGFTGSLSIFCVVRREVPSLAKLKWLVEPGRSRGSAGAASGTHKVSIRILFSFGEPRVWTRVQTVLGKPLFGQCLYLVFLFRPDKRSGNLRDSMIDSSSRCNFVSLFVYSMYSF